MDDGPASWHEAIDMARLAVDDGVRKIVVTPHQLGAYRQNGVDRIRARTRELQERLAEADVPLTVLPGADVRIEPDLVDDWRSGRIMSLADHHRHLLLELPHELYLPLDSLLTRLRSAGCIGILSHPERNQGLLTDAAIVPRLVDAGCLIQITASSLLGGFGRSSQQFAESLLQHGCVHFVASDGHGVNSRRPLLRAASERVAMLTDQDTVRDLFCDYPNRVTQGREVPAGRRAVRRRRRWMSLRRTA